MFIESSWEALGPGGRSAPRKHPTAPGQVIHMFVLANRETLDNRRNVWCPWVLTAATSLTTMAGRVQAKRQGVGHVMLRPLVPANPVRAAVPYIRPGWRVRHL